MSFLLQVPWWLVYADGMADALKRLALRAARRYGGRRRAMVLSAARRSAIASLGGLKRARSLSAARKRAIGLYAASVRWAK